MTGTRYRLVTVQNGQAHVSSVALGADEVLQHLEYEEVLHDMTGWDVAWVHLTGERYPDLLCLNDEAARRIYVRAATPFTDCVTLDGQVTSPRGAVVSPGVPPPKRQRPSLPWLRETDDGFSIDDRL